MGRCKFCGHELTELDHRLGPECPDCGESLCSNCLVAFRRLAEEYADVLLALQIHSGHRNSYGLTSQEKESLGRGLRLAAEAVKGGR